MIWLRIFLSHYMLVFYLEVHDLVLELLLPHPALLLAHLQVLQAVAHHLQLLLQVLQQSYLFI